MYATGHEAWNFANYAANKTVKRDGNENSGRMTFFLKEDSGRSIIDERDAVDTQRGPRDVRNELGEVSQTEALSVWSVFNGGSASL